MNNTYYPGYEAPGLTVDLVLFTVNQKSLQVLLTRRADEPFADHWALPGGFLRTGESLEAAALRVLQDKTGLEEAYLEQLYTFGDPGRDPRNRIITVAYFALVPWQKLARPGSPKVSELAWYAADDTPPLAFDHNIILSAARERVKAKAGYSNIGFGLLPDSFRLTELQQIYEVILGKPLDKRNFRKEMLATGLLEETGAVDDSGAHRPARLYRFINRDVVFFN
jgi:8-oxo-dGTP diphosphatase